jgi:hypothetical protein
MHDRLMNKCRNWLSQWSVVHVCTRRGPAASDKGEGEFYFVQLHVPKLIRERKAMVLAYCTIEKENLFAKLFACMR